MSGGLGLILGAVTGGMAGMGQAGKTALASEQEAQQKQDLVKLQVQMEEDKDLRIAEVNQGYHVTNAATENEYQVARDKALFSQQSKEGGLNRGSEEKRTGMMTSAEVESANIRAGAETGAAKIAADASTANARLAAQAHSVQTLGDGRMMAVSYDPDTKKQVITPLMDPSDPTGKTPLMGVKNLDQQHTLMAMNLRTMAVQYAQSNPELSQQLLQESNDILSGRTPISAAGLPPAKGIPQPALEYLKAHPDATHMQAFEQQFKLPAGSAVRELSKMGVAIGSTAAAPTTPAGTPPLPPGMPPGSSASGYPAAGATPPIPTLPATVTAPTTPTTPTTPMPAQTTQGTAPTTQGPTAAPGTTLGSQPTNWDAFNKGIINDAVNN